MSRALDQALTKRVNGPKISTHPFEHNLTRDIDHVGVPDAALVYDVSHLRARCQFARLRLGAKNRDLRARQIVENELGHGG